MKDKAYYYPYHLEKWRVRQIRNRWYIYRPRDCFPMQSFGTFPHGWKP